MGAPSAGDAARHGVALYIDAYRGVAHVRVVRRGGSHLRPVDRIVGTFACALGDDVSMDEPGPLLMALSDVLAHAADNYRPSGRARYQTVDPA